MVFAGNGFIQNQNLFLGGILLFLCLFVQQVSCLPATGWLDTLRLDTLEVRYLKLLTWTWLELENKNKKHATCLNLGWQETALSLENCLDSHMRYYFWHLPISPKPISPKIDFFIFGRKYGLKKGNATLSAQWHLSSSLRRLNDPNHKEFKATLNPRVFSWEHRFTSPLGVSCHELSLVLAPLRFPLKNIFPISPKSIT